MCKCSLVVHIPIVYIDIVLPCLTLKGPEGGTLCPPFVIKSNNSIKLLIKRMEAQCKFIFACLGPKETSQSVLSVSV